VQREQDIEPISDEAIMNKVFLIILALGFTFSAQWVFASSLNCKEYTGTMQGYDELNGNFAGTFKDLKGNEYTLVFSEFSNVAQTMVAAYKYLVEVKHISQGEVSTINAAALPDTAYAPANMGPYLDVDCR
jgi:hypothetical protein